MILRFFELLALALTLAAIGFTALYQFSETLRLAAV